jgi:unsaturated rhamnogalacturonyl hydrolase
MHEQAARITRLQTVFRRTIKMYQPETPAEELKPGTHLNSWDWGPGLALYGLNRAYPRLDSAGQELFFGFWREWFERNLDRRPPTPAINGTILLNVLWQGANNPKFPLSEEERDYYLGYVRERVAFYLREAYRLPSGAFGHTVEGFPGSNRQVWADNLFLLVLLVAQVAATKENRSLFGQMVQQLQLHFQHLKDPATGLLYHGWQETEKGGALLNEALWGRGNGWAAMGLVELLELAGTPGFESYREPILEVGRPFFEVLLKYQREDGRWSTLLDQTGSYPETSATALTGYAFLKGARLEALGPDFAAAGRKALAALEKLISPEGEVLEVSGSTPPLADLQAYNAVPNDTICTWGQGTALLALEEELRNG